MKLTRSAAAVLVLLALLTWLSWRAINTDAEIYDRALGLLDEFAMVEAALTRDVLSARAGTLRNYDPLVEETNALHELLSRLRGVAVADGGTTAAMDRLAAAVDLQEQLVEHFKSNNALLQNSLVYFGRFNSRSGTVEDLTPLHPAIDALAIAMLHLTLDTSPVSAQEVEQRLNELSQHLAGDDNDAVRGILAHGRLLLQLLPATDNLLKTFSAIPSKLEQETVRATIVQRQGTSRATARRFRFALYGTSLLLLGALIRLGWGLRARALALQRRAALEHMIAGISLTFINALPEEIGDRIEHALGELAECIGADRAYFLMSGTTSHVAAWNRVGLQWTHTWIRTGFTYPPGWPEKALALATQIGSASDDTINISSVASLPPDANKNALISAGVASWACIVRTGSHGASALLGFDGLRRRLMTKSGELGLLRIGTRCHRQCGPARLPRAREDAPRIAAAAGAAYGNDRCARERHCAQLQQYSRCHSRACRDGRGAGRIRRSRGRQSARDPPRRVACS